MENSTLEWTGIAVGVGMSALSFAKIFGYDARRLEQVEKKLDITADVLSNHVSTCATKNIEIAKTSAKVEEIATGLSEAREDQKEARRTQVWIGNSIFRMAEKMHVDLPDPPQ
jgi:hypothetical protein